MKINECFLSFKKNQKFPNLLIIQANELLFDHFKIAQSYLKSLTCKENLFCDNCDSCLKINNKHYLDFYFFDNYNEAVKKDDISFLINTFSKSAFEAKNVKLYVINQIENVNKSSLNALLKFIEEPPINTYGLFFTNNLNKVIDTIKSRAYLLTLTTHDNECYLKSFVSNDELRLLADRLINSAFNEKFQLYDKIRKLSVSDICYLLQILIDVVPFEKKVELLQLKTDFNANLNKNLLCFKLMEVLNPCVQ